MKIGAAYIRVSTDMQLELSPESQLKAIKDYALRNDIVLSNEFIFKDEGISGRKAEKRPAFMQMIAVAKSKPKPFNVILIWKFSRFARNREDSIVYKSMLRKQCGIDVVSISEQLGEDKTSILIEALLEAMDEYYSINLAEEVKRGMTEKARRGGVVSVPPFGYVMGKDRFEIDPERAEIVRQIFDKFIREQKTLPIAKWLNDNGITTRSGKTFANRSVKYILTNPVYIGKMRWNTDGKATSTSVYIPTENTMIIDGKHDPIISEEKFNEVQTLISQMAEKYSKGSHQTPSEYMLRGMVKCSTCGATMCMSAKKGLQCSKYIHGQCTVSHYIMLEKLNQSVIEALRADMSRENFWVKSKPKTNAAEAERLKTQIKKERLKLDRIKVAYENGADTLEEYKANKQRITASIDKLEEQLVAQSVGEEKLIDIKNEITEAYEVATNPEISDELKNRILRSLLKKIVFDRSTNSVEIFYNF